MYFIIEVEIILASQERFYSCAIINVVRKPLKHVPQCRKRLKFQLLERNLMLESSFDRSL